MDRHDRLYENYEDALFTLLMDQVAEERGARLLEENSRLQDDPDAAVPDELNRKSRETIRRALRPPRRYKHSFAWYAGRVAVLILLLVAVASIAYASVLSAQVRKLEAQIGSSDTSSQLTVTSENDGWSEIGSKPVTLVGFRLPALSKTFSVTDQGSDGNGDWIVFGHTNGTSVQIAISNRELAFLDTEDTDYFKETKVNGYAGMIAEEGDTVRVSWYDSDREKTVLLTTVGFGRDVTLDFAEQIEYVG